MPKKENIFCSAVLLFAVVTLRCVLANENMSGKRTKKSHVAVVYSSNYQISFAGLEKLHSFDIQKYKKIYKQLVIDGIIKAKEFYKPEQISKEDILLVHSEKFLKNLKNSKTVAEYLEAPFVRFFPAGIVDHCALRPLRYATGGTLLAAQRAIEDGIGINIGGGYHHAKPDKGEGFCIYADMPIAIRKLKQQGKINRALIIDLDVHQGNGTAVCLAGDDSTFTFSMHQRDIYPVPKEKSDADIELEPGTGDKEYLSILSKCLPRLFEKSKPDIVFLQAGCDTLANDPLASLDMTEQGIVERDAKVIELCVSRNIPVVMTTGGGYSENAWRVQYASIRNIIETYGLSACQAKDSFRGKTIQLLQKAGLGDRLDAGVNISMDKDGLVCIADEGSFFMQYVVKEPNISADANLIIEPNLKISSSCSRVVVVTHGWIDKASSEWPADVAKQIRQKTDPNQWTCGVFDWRGGAAVVNPVDAAKYGKEISGPRLAKALLKIKPADLEHIHLIGHSAGCWTINSAAKILTKETDAEIHLTFLDAYVPSCLDESELGNIESTKKVWAEHYYTKDLTLKYTHTDLSNAHNVDITEIDKLIKEHKFPYRWYYATIAGQYRESDGKKSDEVITKLNGLEYGFARSREAGEENWQKSLKLKKGRKAVELNKPEKVK